MSLPSVALCGGAITTDCPPPAPKSSIDDARYSAIHPQENGTSSSTLVPGNHLRGPLHDASLNTLNMPPRTLNFLDYVQWSPAGTPHSAQSSYTSPTSNVTPVSASSLSVRDTRFLELKHTLPGAATLLTFLCSLHPDDIPEILLCRMWSTRECWNSDGEIEHVNVTVNAPLGDLLTCRTQFYENIRLLECFDFIKSEPGALGKRKFSIKPELQEHIMGITPNLQDLEWLRLVLVCHSFPGRLEEIGSVFDTLDYADLLIIRLTALVI